MRKMREIHDEPTNIWPQLDEQQRQQAMQQLRRATSIMEGLAEKSTSGLSKQEWSAVDGQVIELIEGLDRGKEVLKAFIEGMSKIN